jgi:hypothetical protein
MDAESKKEIDELKAALKASDARAAKQDELLKGVLAMAGMQDEGKRAAAAEIARKQKVVADLKAKAIELSGEAKPAVLKYRIGEVMHYRRGVMYKRGEVIALPNDDEPTNQPSWTWTPFDSKVRAEDPVVLADRKAMSQLAKEQAQKPVGPLAPPPKKDKGRPQDTEV